MSDEEREVAAEQRPEEEPGGPAPSVAERLAFYQRAGGLVTPLLTALLAFLIGGLVVLATRHEPAHDLPGDLRRHRPQLALPVGDRRRPHARRAQPPADAAR